MVRSLHQGRPCALQVHSRDLRLTGQDRNVLAQGSLFDTRLESLSDLFVHYLKRQRPAGNTLINGHNMKAVTGLDELAEDSCRPQSEERLLELGNRIAATDLPEIAALSTGGTI
jgi:hypothetical protein